MHNYGKWYVINNVRQYVHIISQNLDNPVLLYLHGGPGDAALPLIEHFNAELSQKYTLVIWEQRGAGKSYYKFTKDEKITINDFVNDLKVLIDKVLLEFNKEKVCLMGHSWGSIMGMKFIIKYPQIIDFYVGIGQVINSQEMFKDSKEYILKHITNVDTRNKILSIDTNFIRENWNFDLMFLMGQLIKVKGSLYGKKSYASLYKYFLFSKNYSIMDCRHRIKGSDQSIDKLWQEVAQIDFTGITKFDVPVIFIEGEDDYHVSSKVAYNFYEKIETPKKYICIKDAAHFPQWTRADAFNSIVNTLSTSRSWKNEYVEV